MKLTEKPIDRTELLASTRTEFLSAFVAGIEPTLSACVQHLFEKADRCPNWIGQRRYLDARGILQNRLGDLLTQMQRSMEKMLNRSLQTTYSNYRPAFPTSLLDGGISLVDTSAFEDELRLNEITERFRNEAGEQLRDLNIRIALLFEQEDIKERENPFRPYLFSRTIAMAVESLGANPDLNTVLIEQVAEDFSGQIAAIYEAVNAHLAQHGIAAQLLRKPKRAAGRVPPSGGGVADRADDGEYGDDGFQRDQGDQDDRGDQAYQGGYAGRGYGGGRGPVDGAGPHGRDQRQSRHGQVPGHDQSYEAQGADSSADEQERQDWNAPWQDQFDLDGREISTDVPASPVERLFKSVKAMATKSTHGGAAGGHAAQGGGYAAGGAATGMPRGGGYRGGAYNGGFAPNGASGAGAGAGGRAGMNGNPASHAGIGNGQPAGAMGGNGEAGGGAFSNVSWVPGTQGVGQFLRKFFSGSGVQEDLSSAMEKSGAQSGAARPAIGILAGSVQTLLQQNTPATEEMYTSNGDIRNLILERREDLNEKAHDLREQMTIDIVSMLFEFILRDTQVPAEVRAQLGRLQFLVLKVALRDESLLTEKAHPARMLVNRIGSISLGLNQIDPSGANVTAEICRIVSEMLADQSESPGLFSKMLDDLDKFIAHELRANDKSVAGVVEAVEQAESRTLRFARTAAQMSEALSGLTINEHLKRFLENDWARAIERAERTNAELATHYRLLVPDLLWSVLPKVTDDERHRLLASLPIILKTIHSGMEAVGWEAAEKQTLMDWLFDAHAVVLRGGGANGATTSLGSIHDHFDNFVQNTEKAAPTKPFVVAPESHKSFLEEAMRDLDVRIQMLDQLFDKDEELAQDAVAAEDDPQPALDIAERLRIGVGIEINLGGKPSIGRLNWHNPDSSNLVLTLNNQTEPSMISVRMFQRLLNHDRVRFLESEPIFERAVESLLISANQLA